MKFIYFILFFCFNVDYLGLENFDSIYNVRTIRHIDNKNTLVNTVRATKNGFMGKIAINIFSFKDKTLNYHKKFKEKKIKNIESFINNAFTDVSQIIFYENSVSAYIRIVPEINVLSNCSNQLVKVSPAFLQTIFMKSLNSAIEINARVLSNRVYFKNSNDFFRILFSKTRRLKVLSKENNGIKISSEMKRIVAFVDYELTKALAFVFGHESYHFLSSCKMGLKHEYDADALGVLIYQFLNHSISYDISKLTNRFFTKEEAEIISTKPDELILQTFTGRSIYKIIQNIYLETKFEQSSATHPSLTNRLERVDSLINKTHPDQLYNYFIKTNILKPQNHEN